MADTSDNEKSTERKRLKVVKVATIAGLPNPDHEALREQVGAFLYVIEFDDAVKIGVSQNPYRRAINLRTGSGRYSNRAAYAGPFPNATRAERELLSMFAIQRIADSEWVNVPFDDVIDEARLIDAPIMTEEDLLKAASRGKAGERSWNAFRHWFEPDQEALRDGEREALRQQLRLILPMFYVLIQEAETKDFDGLTGVLERGCPPKEFAARVMEVLNSGGLEFWAEDLANFYFKNIKKSPAECEEPA